MSKIIVGIMAAVISLTPFHTQQAQAPVHETPVSVGENKPVKKKPKKPSVSKKMFLVTAYTNAEGVGNKGITASGTHTSEGRTISCPPWIPFGTRVYIPLFKKTFICEDRGSAIQGNHIDVYMQDVKQAVNFGARQLEIDIVLDDPK